jgi:hypothetical protein
VRDADQTMSVMEKLSDIWNDPIHQNPSHLQVFPNRQGFESPREQKNIKYFYKRPVYWYFQLFFFPPAKKA